MFSTFGYIIIIVGALSLSVNIMRLIDRLERPRSRRRRGARSAA